MTKKTVKPTVYRYSIVDKASGKRDNVKDVVCTYRHSGIIELLTIGNDFLVYEEAAIKIEKY